jgi:hypothetical protein
MGGKPRRDRERCAVVSPIVEFPPIGRKFHNWLIRKEMSRVTISVMSRVEKKYTVDAYTYLRLLKTVERNTVLDEYNRKAEFYTISNLYYDTSDNDLIRLSLSKPEYKEKIRLRAYGVPNGYDSVYLEVKKKYRGLANKRREEFYLYDAYEFLETRAVPSGIEKTQIAKELEYTLKRYAPEPKVYIAYDRRAYFGENGLRITFDTNIRTRRYDLRLEDGDYGEALLDGDVWLMEIKAESAFPIWLTRLLSECGVFSNSFSKYGTEYIKFITEGSEEECLNPSLRRQPKQERQPSLGREYALRLA